MIDVKWLGREIGSQKGVIYRVIYEHGPVTKDVTDVEADLATIINDIVQFAKDRFPVQLDRSEIDLDGRLLSFLVRTASSRETELLAVTPHSGGIPREQADYIFSRYITHIEKRSPVIFDRIVKITGVALLAEALSEIRQPSLIIPKRGNDLTTFLDGPLAMDYLNVSGTSAEEAASFTINHLKSRGMGVSILGQSCDEIKANLQALFNTPPIQRYGLTHTALTRGEVKEDICRMVMNNPEHALKSGIPAALPVDLMPIAPIEHTAFIWFNVGERPRHLALLRSTQAYPIPHKADLSPHIFIHRIA
jgi:hypothetical protein